MERDDINWQFAPIKENPAYLESRGSLLTKIPEIRWRGPSSLQVKENWLSQLDIKPSAESEKEVKFSKEPKSIGITLVEIQDDFDLVLRKFDLHKAFRISAWIL